MQRDEIIARLQEIAARLSGAPAETEQSAQGDLARRRARNPDDPIGYHPHQAGALEQVCRSTSNDVCALIRRLQSDRPNGERAHGRRTVRR